jgi:thiol-disulfide isomerase/thioredoxin
MKNLSLSSFVLALGLLISASDTFAAGDKLAKPSKPLPALSGSGQLAGVDKGDLVIYQFWASWCTGCGTVMSQLGKTLESFPKVAYVSVSLDETKDVALKFFANKPDAAKFALSKSYLDDSGKYFAEASKVDSLPYVIVAKKDGTILKRFKGHPSQQELESLLKKGA